MHMSTKDEFIPPAILRGSYTQTILASARIRAAGRNPMKDASREMIIDAGNGVRLQGFSSPQLKAYPRGLVILLHGWEGSAESTYILHSGRYFFENGYSVFRLNFRDHGQSHHLNEGLFNGTLLDEVFNAVQKACELPGGMKTFLVGFSIGGNFALRIARRCSEEANENISHIVAVSPVIDPGSATDAIDRSLLLRHYFLRKWRRSLLRNQELYPHLYDFGAILGLQTIRGLTDALFRRYGPFQDAEEYFRRYSIAGDALKNVSVPTTIIGARDDPAIPIRDFSGLRPGPGARLIIHEFGGHNGFLNGVFKPTWYENEALRTFAASP